MKAASRQRLKTISIGFAAFSRSLSSRRNQDEAVNTCLMGKLCRIIYEFPLSNNIVCLFTLDIPFLNNRLRGM